MKAASSLALLLVASVAGADPLAELEQAQEALFDEIQPSVVVVSNDDSFGSGFFVSDDGLVLTSAHVVGTDDDWVELVLPDGRKVPGRVIERGKDLDLALVATKHRGPPALLLGGADLRVGAWVGAVGHGMGGVWAFTTGMVTNIYPEGPSRPVFQTQIPLNPGNSGGPIFDRRGRVVGVVTVGVKESSSMNLAIRVDAALAGLAQLGARCNCLTIVVPPGAPVFVDDRYVGQGPTVVLAAEPRAYEVTATVRGKVRRERVVYPATRRLEL